MQPDNPGPSSNAASVDARRILPPNLVTSEFDFNATSLITHPPKLRFQSRPTPRIRKKDNAPISTSHGARRTDRPVIGAVADIYSPGCKWLSGASGAAAAVPETLAPGTKPIHVQIDHRRRIKRQHLAEDEAADDRDTERLSKLAAVAHADRQRKRAEHAPPWSSS